MHPSFQDQEARDIHWLMGKLGITTMQNSPDPIHDQVEFYYNKVLQICDSGKLLDHLQKLYSEQKKHEERQVQGLTFSLALENLKLGKKVARKGWNGKGMWIALGAGQENLPSDKFWNKHSKAHAEQNGGKANVLPYIIFKTANDEILMGWLASQTDMLSDDWEIVK